MIPLRNNITSKTKPFINWLLVLANGYLFYIELRFGNPEALNKFIAHWSVIPSRLWADITQQWITLFTATFLHGGWTHLIGNMLFLYVFGRSVEDRMGHMRYFIFYLSMGLLANATEAYIAFGSSLPMLGASGAVAGVLGSYFFYYPYSRILTLIPFGIFSRIVEIPAFLFLGFWFLMQTIQGTLALGVKTMQNTGGVAWWAHASGFIGGLLLGPALSKKKTKWARN